MDGTPVTAEELEMLPSDRAEGILSGTLITHGRATIVVLTTDDGLIAVGHSVAPARRPDTLIGFGLAKRNAIERMRRLRERRPGLPEHRKAADLHP